MPLSIGSPFIGDTSFHLYILLDLRVVFSSKCKAHLMKIIEIYLLQNKSNANPGNACYQA